MIGDGKIEKGDFTEINWGENSYFVKIEMDVKGGTNYRMIGASQLYAVPYALYAEKAGALVEPEEEKVIHKIAFCSFPAHFILLMLDYVFRILMYSNNN